MTRVSIVKWNLKEVGGPISGLTNRNHIRLLLNDDDCACFLVDAIAQHLEAEPEDLAIAMAVYMLGFSGYKGFY